MQQEREKPKIKKGERKKEKNYLHGLGASRNTCIPLQLMAYLHDISPGHCWAGCDNMRVYRIFTLRYSCVSAGRSATTTAQYNCVPFYFYLQQRFNNSANVQINKVRV